MPANLSKLARCSHCGSEFVLQPSRWRCCEECRAKFRAASRKLCARRRASGLCYRCGQPSPGGKICRTCSSRDRTRRLQRTQRGLCQRCPQPVKPGQVLCAEHAVLNAEAVRRWKQARRAIASSKEETKNHVS